MEYSSEPPPGQEHIMIKASLVAKIKQQCDSWQMLRGWHSHFDRSISLVDQTAAIKGYDLILDGVINARQIAREMGFALPDVSKLKWELTPRPEIDQPAQEF